MMFCKSGAQTPKKVKDFLSFCVAVFMKYTAIWSHILKKCFYNHLCAKYGWNNIIEGGADYTFTILLH